MSKNESTTPAYKPFVSADTVMNEMTVRGLVIGAILGIIFAASSVYLGLKVGLTVSASIPIAVISITILRRLGRPTILENNIVQTTGSAGESIAAGVAFTLPSLLLMGFDLEIVRLTLVAILGGTLGVLMMIPLRHGLIVKDHAKLPYPEGTACAQVLIVGEKGGTSAKTVFTGFGIGAAFNILGNVFKTFSVGPELIFKRFKGGSFAFDCDPTLLGVGYIIGTRTSLVMLAGGMLSFLVIIPMIVHFGPELTSPIVAAGGRAVKDMSPGQIRNAFVLYIGAGAVATGGIITLLRSLPTIISAFKRGLGNVGAAAAGTARTDRDLSMKYVLFGAVGLVAAIALAPQLGINPVSSVLIVLFGFFFVTVSSRICGEIGSSSNPISGMTVATLLITCLLFVAAGWTGVTYKEMALCTAALVCVAASNGGTISQDLKTGYLVGGTPRLQQIAIIVGVWSSALVIGWTLMYLNESYTTFEARNYPAFQATAARVAAAPAGELALADKPMTFSGKEWQVLYVRKDTDGVPRGKYLVGDAGTIAYVVDPGVCGTVIHGLDVDGNPKTIEKKFDAPKAQLFRLIIDGVLEQNLPWALVLVGVFIALMMEILGVSSLPFAVGAYLPLSTSVSICVGGIVRAVSNKITKLSATEAESSPGVLFASGLIAGGAVAGLVSTGMDGTGAIANWGLDVGTTVFKAIYADELLSFGWSSFWFVGLAAMLFIAAKKKK